MKSYRPRPKPQPGDVLLASLVPGALVLGMILMSLCGCDLGGSTDAGFSAPAKTASAELESEGAGAGPTLAAPTACDGTCDALHCANVAQHRDEHAAAGRWAFVACLDAELACLHAPDAADGCGTCEHQAAECMTDAAEAIDECEADGGNDTCAQGWDHWCHLVLDAAGQDCAADCSTAALACLEDDATCGGGCFATAAACRVGCT